MFCAPLTQSLQLEGGRAMLDTDAAYFAGILDGEGCISFRRQGRSFGLQLIVAQKDPAITTWLSERIGGHVDVVVKHQWKQPRTYYRWTMGGKAHIEPALRAAFPYLTLKKLRASYALEFLTTIIDGGKSWHAPWKPIRGAVPKTGRPHAISPELMAIRLSIIKKAAPHLLSSDLVEDGPDSSEGFSH
jgi:hypothetical protein